MHPKCLHIWNVAGIYAYVYCNIRLYLNMNIVQCEKRPRLSRGVLTNCRVTFNIQYFYHCSCILLIREQDILTIRAPSLRCFILVTYPSIVSRFQKNQFYKNRCSQHQDPNNQHTYDICYSLTCMHQLVGL